MVPTVKHCKLYRVARVSGLSFDRCGFYDLSDSGVSCCPHSLWDWRNLRIRPGLETPLALKDFLVLANQAKGYPHHLAVLETAVLIEAFGQEIKRTRLVPFSKPNSFETVDSLLSL